MVCLEFSLFVTDALDLWRNPRGRPLKQQIGTIHPVDMRYHGVKSTRGNLLKTQVLLDIFMKKLYCPAQTIPEHDLTCCRFDIITGEILAATVRLFTACWATYALRLTQNGAKWCGLT
jgi:hypothetical protein